jgi:arsenate reductase-like glutaredoxin family protein
MPQGDIGHMYFNFLQYWWNETATHNKNSFNNLINKLNKPSSKYNVNTCDFLDEDKLKLKLQEIIEQSQKSCIGLVDDKKHTEQIEYIKIETYKLKLSDYVLQSDLSDRVLSNIGKFTGVNKPELKIEELYSYFNFFNSDYFTTLTQQYLDRFIINDSAYNLLVKTDIIKNLKNLNFVHKIGKTDGVNSLSILFKENFISLRNKTDQPYDKEDAKSDFEQSDVIQYPSIKIFCTEKNFNNDTFNRFTYFHEIGHFVTRGGYSIKINNDDICIGTLDGNTCKEYGYSFKIKDHLKNLGHTALIDNIMNCADLKKIHELFSQNKNSPVFTDIFSDIFALDIIINEMKEAGTTDEEILENIANICMVLGGDNNHFSKELRFALNVFFNPILKRTYEQEISRLPVDIYIPQKSVEEY